MSHASTETPGGPALGAPEAKGRPALSSSRILAVIALCLVALAASACGGGKSDSDKAKSQACDAKSDIQEQITTLKGLPLSSSSIDKAKASVTSIGDDLKTIQDAAPKVSGDLKDQLQQANESFKSEVQSITQSITSASSVTGIATALATAGTNLEKAYQSAFSSVKC